MGSAGNASGMLKWVVGVCGCVCVCIAIDGVVEPPIQRRERGGERKRKRDKGERKG